MVAACTVQQRLVHLFHGCFHAIALIILQPIVVYIVIVIVQRCLISIEILLFNCSEICLNDICTSTVYAIFCFNFIIAVYNAAFVCCAAVITTAFAAFVAAAVCICAALVCCGAVCRSCFCCTAAIGFAAAVIAAAAACQRGSHSDCHYATQNGSPTFFHR